MTRIIFIHGNEVLRWNYAWAPWLKEKLEKAGFETIFETFPDSIIARRRYWLQFLKEELHAGNGDVLVGHSSGALAAMRYSEENKLKGIVLVAPAHTDLGRELEKQSGYFDDPWQWEKIKQNNSFIGMFYSEDDPHIANEEFDFIAEKLDPDKHAFTNKGHFNDNTFPELLQYIKEKA